MASSVTIVASLSELDYWAHGFTASPSRVVQPSESSGVTVPLWHSIFYGPVQRPADTTHYHRRAPVPVCGASVPARLPDSPQRKRHRGLLVCEGRHARHAERRAVLVARLHTR